MIRLKKLTVSVLLTALFWASCPALEAKNPLATYFSGLLDESRVEIAIGKMLFEGFRAETGGASKTASLPDIDAMVEQLSVKTPRTAIPYKVYILDSRVPGEIAFPGGAIVITAGMLAIAATPQERTFLVARNIMQIALRNPMTVIKKEGIYGSILKVLKVPENKRDPEAVGQILKTYIKAAMAMDQKRADREAVKLFENFQDGRQAGLSLLRKLKQELWAFMPWELFDLPGRIQNLETIIP